MNWLDVLRRATKRIVGPAQGHALDLLIDSLRLRERGSVLELGCGNGWAMERIADRFEDRSIRIVGADLFARGRKPGRGGVQQFARRDVEFVKCDVARLPFGDDSFDVVFSVNAFHHFGNPGETIDEAQRVLRRGGELFVVDHCNDYLTMKALNIVHKMKEANHYTYYSTEGLSTLLESRGFRDVFVRRKRATWFWGLMLVRGVKGASGG